MGYEAELLSQININCKEFPPYAPLSDYNVFHILGISAKEVIMCRFLADLLNPEGQHGCGISFLKSFMHDVLYEYSMSDILLARTEVAAEYVIDNDTKKNAMKNFMTEMHRLVRD